MKNNKKGLMDQIIEASNKINKSKTRSERDNWIITSSRVADKLRESFDKYEQEQIKKNRDTNIDNLLDGEGRSEENN